MNRQIIPPSSQMKLGNFITNINGKNQKQVTGLIGRRMQHEQNFLACHSNNNNNEHQSRRRMLFTSSHPDSKRLRYIVPPYILNRNIMCSVMSRLYKNCDLRIHKHFNIYPISSSTASYSTTLNNNNEEKSNHSHHGSFQIYEQAVDCFGEPITFLSSSSSSVSSNEPITNITTDYTFSSKNNNVDFEMIQNSILSLDTHLLCVISRGKSSTDGGDDEGVPTKAAHSSSIPWTELLQNIYTQWCSGSHSTTRTDHHHHSNHNHDNNLECFAPMLAVVALSPLLAHSGVAYVSNLDHHYCKHITFFSSPSSKRGIIKQNHIDTSLLPSFRFLSLAHAAIKHIDSPHLSPREKYHLLALKFMLMNEHQKAIYVLHKLLQTCPGDILALHLLLELSHTTGLIQLPAFSASTSVASYWSERGYKTTLMGTTPIPGYALGSSLISLGLSIGGRYREAEALIEKSMTLDHMVSGVGSLTLSHIYNGEGRISEGTSLLSGFDGSQHYNSCGFLFHESILNLYGARFALDRDGASSDRVALRMYDESIGRILSYSGYNSTMGDDAYLEYGVPAILREVPARRRDMMSQAASHAAKSIWGSLFGTVRKNDDDSSSLSSQDQTNDNPVVANETFNESSTRNLAKMSIEDILAWLPPTPTLMSEATFLLFRLTISGAIQADDERWIDLSNSWKRMIHIEKSMTLPNISSSESHQIFKFSPLARIASSLALRDRKYLDLDDNVGNQKIDNAIDSSVCDKLEEAAVLLGKMMKLGKIKVGNSSVESKHHATSEQDEKENNDGNDVKNWKKIVDLLSTAKCGWMSIDTNGSDLIRLKSDNFEGWDINIHNFIEHAICYSAINAQDLESLHYARSICSESVTIRSNSPETFWRYSVILEKLGDHAAAEDARAASISLGSGEGGQVNVR